MDVREFPVLTEADQPIVDRFAAGLGEDAARILAYLQLRHDDADLDRTATATAIHIGTGVGRHAVRAALEELTDAGLVAETSIRTSTPGRPPKAWHAVDEREETLGGVYAHHARRLRRQSVSVASAVTDGFDGTSQSADGPVSLDETPARPPESVADPIDVSIALNWTANGLHLPLFAARSIDDDRAPTGSTLSVAFAEHEGSRAAIEAVDAGDHEVCVAGAVTLLRELDRGRSVVPVAVPFQRSTVVLYATRESFGGRFESVDQLRGRRVGMPADAETGLLGRLLLEQAGVREAVELVDVAGEERAALQSQRVDAVTGMAPDTYRFEATADRTVDVVTVTDQFPVYGPTLAVARETLQERPVFLEAVLATAMAGWLSAALDPDGAAAAMAGVTEEPATRLAATFDRARAQFGESEAVRKRGWGWHSPLAWRDLRAALAQGGTFDDG